MRSCNDQQNRSAYAGQPAAASTRHTRCGHERARALLRILAAARRGELSGRDYSLIVIGAVLALAETGSDDSFKSLHEAASRSTKHIFQNRAHRVDAPSPQSASERRKGITTTQEDDVADGFH